jgi:hypothetical protein
MRAPRTLAMERSIHHEQPIRVPRLLCLIHGARFQRHRYRVRFVRAGIVKLPVNQNGDWNQSALITAVKLHNAHRPRLLAILRFLVFLRPVFPGSNLRPILLPHTSRQG